MHLRVALPEPANGLTEEVATSLYGQLFFLEETLRTLLTVVDYLARLF